MDDDRRRWDERYVGREPADPVAPEALDGHDELLALLPASGRALDVACGVGPQSLWLAERGFSVIALDISPVAIDRVIAAAGIHGVTDGIDARVHDLDDGLPPDAHDLDIVVCQRFRGPDLYDHLVRALRPGGIAIVTVLSVVGVDGEPGAFHAPAGELTDAFGRPDVDILAHDEGAGLASVVVRRRQQ